MPSNHPVLCCPLLLLSSIFPNIRVFYSESVLPIKRPKCWSFSFSISPSNDYLGLISFRITYYQVSRWKECQARSPQTPIVLTQNSHHLSYVSSLPCSCLWSISRALICLFLMCSVQSCPALCDPMEFSLPGFSVHGIFQASILEMVVISFSRQSSWPRGWTHVSCVSCIGRWFFYQLNHQGS